MHLGKKKKNHLKRGLSFIFKGHCKIHKRNEIMKSVISLPIKDRVVAGRVRWGVGGLRRKISIDQPLCQDNTYYESLPDDTDTMGSSELNSWQSSICGKVNGIAFSTVSARKYDGGERKRQRKRERGFSTSAVQRHFPSIQGKHASPAQPPKPLYATPTRLLTEASFSFLLSLSLSAQASRSLKKKKKTPPL